MSTFDLSLLINQPTIDNQLTVFNSLMCDLLERSVPLQEVVVRRPPAPWLSPELRALMHQRDACFRASKRSRSAVVKARYVELRREVKAKLTAAKSAHLQSRFAAVGNSRLFWREINKLGLMKLTNKSIPADLSLEQLNNHFVSVASREPLPAFSVVLPTLAEFGDSNIFSFSNITARSVNEAVSRIDTRACGPDEVPIQAYKVFQSLLAPLIVQLFNQSLNSGDFPSLWKFSFAVPLPKVRYPVACSDFRPISLLCALSKVLERVVYEQTMKFLAENNSLDPRQTGFREGMGTQTAVLRLVDDIRSGIENRKVTVAVFLDFSKAFDTVDHRLLLGKLQALGFSEGVIRWYHSYLCGRLQAVRDAAGNASEWLPLNSGVPQGSVLGPLLFTIFINNLPQCLLNCDYLLYADDLVIYLACTPETLENSMLLLNEDIGRIAGWCLLNKLTLNIGKTKAMAFGSARYINALNMSEFPVLLLHGEPIEFVVSFRYLGVILDSTLSWTEHITQVCKKSAGALYRLRMNDAHLNLALKRRLVVALVFPIFDYCAAVLTNLSDGLENKLRVALNNCVRFLLRLPRSVHISHHRRSLGWLEPYNRRRLFIGCIFYKALCLGVSALFADQLRLRPNVVRRRDPSRTDTLCVPSTRTVSFQKSFLVVGINFWNSLPPVVTSASTIGEFRASCFRHLMLGEVRSAGPSDD